MTGGMHYRYPETGNGQSRQQAVSLSTDWQGLRQVVERVIFQKQARVRTGSRWYHCAGTGKDQDRQ